mgnify:CR=1 FL=1
MNSWNIVLQWEMRWIAPDLHNADEVLRLMVKAVEKAGYQPGKEVAIALDVAASELYDKNF